MSCKLDNYEMSCELLEKLRPRMLSICHSMLRYRRNAWDDAQDVVSAATARMILNFKRGTQYDNLEAWAMKCTRHECLNFIRAEKIQPEVSLDDPNCNYARYILSEDTGTEYIKKEALNIVQRILDSAALNCPNCRTFKEFLELETTYEAAAKRLGMPLGTLKNRIYRARAYLYKRTYLIGL